MRIGELADALGLNPKTIRYYESIGLLPEPERTASGYRDYGPMDMERVSFVKTAQRLGLSLDEIGEVISFRDRGERPCGRVRALLRRQIADLGQRIDDMRELRDELRRLEGQVGRLQDTPSTFCGVIEHVQRRSPEPVARA